MTGVELPALDGRFALGFLAALGATRLLNVHGVSVRLAWHQASSRARLHSDEVRTVDDIVEALCAIVTALPEGSVAPGVTPGFPPPARSGSDPIRVVSAQLEDSARQWIRHSPGAGEWVGAFVSDLVGDPTARVAITPFTAPSGQQKFRTLLEKPLHDVRADPQRRLTEALTSWIRVPGCTGEYLDHRVLFSAADASGGKSSERGVPGATWLAIMALPLFPVYGNERFRTVTSGWHYHPGIRKPILSWPLWEQPLDLYAAQALLRHPAVIPRLTEKHEGVRQLTSSSQAAKALGVFAIHTAQRRKVRGRNFDGVLAPFQNGEVTMVSD